MLPYTLTYILPYPQAPHPQALPLVVRAREDLVSAVFHLLRTCEDLVSAVYTLPYLTFFTSASPARSSTCCTCARGSCQRCIYLTIFTSASPAGSSTCCMCARGSCQRCVPFVTHVQGSCHCCIYLTLPYHFHKRLTCRLFHLLYARARILSALCSICYTRARIFSLLNIPYLTFFTKRLTCRLFHLLCARARILSAPSTSPVWNATRPSRTSSRRYLRRSSKTKGSIMVLHSL